jgi:SAM-dependent methyltransferase
MARHMLYHVPDIDRAVAEAARVLVPGGAFLAVTNSAHTMAEYWALTEETAVRFPGMRSPERRYRFSLENGASFLTPYFAHVETHRLPGTLRFPEAEPLVGYFASTRALTLRPGHTESEWQAILKFVRARVQDTIDRDGHFDVGKLTGAFVGRKGG